MLSSAKEETGTFRPKCLRTSTELHGATTQETVLSVIDVRIFSQHLSDKKNVL